MHPKKHSDLLCGLMLTGGFTATPSPSESSPAYGLLGLLPIMRAASTEQAVVSIGTDLTALGLNLNSQE